MQYENLNVDQQKQMLEQRLTQYEAEHYQHQLNVQLLKATGANDEQTLGAITAGEAAMVTLDDAHANTKKELAKLNKGSKGK